MKADQLKVFAALTLLSFGGLFKEKWAKWRQKWSWFRWLTDEWSPQTEKWLTRLATLLLILSIAGPLCYTMAN